MRRKASRAAKKKAQPKAMLGLPDPELEYEAIKKQQSSQCLVWGRGSQPLVVCQKCQKRRDLNFSHLAGWNFP